MAAMTSQIPDSTICICSSWNEECTPAAVFHILKRCLAESQNDLQSSPWLGPCLSKKVLLVHNLEQFKLIFLPKYLSLIELILLGTHCLFTAILTDPLICFHGVFALFYSLFNLHQPQI